MYYSTNSIYIVHFIYYNYVLVYHVVFMSIFGVRTSLDVLGILMNH